MLPDEIHGFPRHATWLTVDSAMTGYFDRVLAHVPVPKAGRSMSN